MAAHDRGELAIPIATRRNPMLPPRIICAGCGHSHLVHSERGTPCLYAECQCPGWRYGRVQLPEDDQTASSDEEGRGERSGPEGPKAA
jgi:hypothetical protein